MAPATAAVPRLGRAAPAVRRAAQYGAPTQYDPYSAPSPYAATTTRYLTMDDVVTKTGITFLVTVLAAAAVWALPGHAGWGLPIPAVLVGVRPRPGHLLQADHQPGRDPGLRALSKGLFLGTISEAYNDVLRRGIVMQAVIGTFGVFAGMLIVYKTGAIRVTPKLTRWMIGALARRPRPDGVQPGGRPLFLA